MIEYYTYVLRASIGWIDNNTVDFLRECHAQPISCGFYSVAFSFYIVKAEIDSPFSLTISTIFHRYDAISAL